MTTFTNSEFMTEPSEVASGQPVKLFITVKDSNGITIHNLQMNHEKVMHLLVISEDLNVFEHLHPLPIDDGSFCVSHKFQYGGNYWVYADFIPTYEIGPLVEKFNLFVNGQTYPTELTLEDMINIKTVQKNGLSVTINTGSSIHAGKETTLLFSVSDPITNTPITDLEPYLGAVAHFVAISQDGNDFLHAHPLGHSKKYTHHKSSSPDEQKSKQPIHHEDNTSNIGASITFPRSGLYKIWAQFKRKKNVITTSFVVNIK